MKKIGLKAICLLVLLISINYRLFAQAGTKIVEDALNKMAIRVAQKYYDKTGKKCPNCQSVNTILSNLEPHKNPKKPVHNLRYCIENIKGSANAFSKEPTQEISEYLTKVFHNYVPSGEEVGRYVRYEDVKDIIEQTRGRTEIASTSADSSGAKPQNQVLFDSTVNNTRTYIDRIAMLEQNTEELQTELQTEESKNNMLQGCLSAASAVLLLTTAALIWLVFGKKKSSSTRTNTNGETNPREASREDFATSTATNNTSSDATKLNSVFKGAKMFHDVQANSSSEWLIVGASATGKGHLSTGVCQDNFHFGKLSNNWQYIVVCDGAGSALLSDKGSEYLAKHAIPHLINDSIIEKTWATQNRFPDEEAWRGEALELFQRVKNAVKVMAQNNNKPTKDFASTLILAVITSKGVLSAHIGDGRAGYRNKIGEWQPIMIPYKGIEANSTVFITSDWSAELLETRVIQDDVTGVAVLTDGCEQHAFECSMIEPLTNRWSDPNRPYPKFFEPVLSKIIELKANNANQADLESSWKTYLERGTPQLENEVDDKTMVIAINATEFKKTTS